MVAIRKLICTLVCLMICHATAHASSIYAVDPARSWVSAYVPKWVPNSEGWSFTDENGQQVSLEPTWRLEWTLARLPLSGTFEGTIDLSPWVPDAAHFMMSQKQFVVALPGWEVFSPPDQLTFSVATSAVVSSCLPDHFFPGAEWQSVCAWSYGDAEVRGTVNGEALNIEGFTGGLVYGPFFSEYFAGPFPPSSDHIYYPDWWSLTMQPHDYRIVAHVVPEPETLFLILFGLFAARKLAAGNERSALHRID